MPFYLLLFVSLVSISEFRNLFLFITKTNYWKLLIIISIVSLIENSMNINFFFIFNEQTLLYSMLIFETYKIIMKIILEKNGVWKSIPLLSLKLNESLVLFIFLLIRLLRWLKTIQKCYFKVCYSYLFIYTVFTSIKLPKPELPIIIMNKQLPLIHKCFLYIRDLHTIVLLISFLGLVIV